MTLFFYGSLRKGQDNYLRFTQQWPGQITDVASGYIAGFELVTVGANVSIAPAAASSTVAGDVRDVSDEVFQAIEKLEQSFNYRRETVVVQTSDGRRLTAEAY